LLRLIGLTSLFVVITQAASWAVRFGATGLTHGQPDIGWRLAAAGFIGLVGMAGAIVAGVRLGTRVGIGRDAQRQGPFVWWVTNRLLFLAALGSIQGFALYFLSDVHHLPNPAAATTLLAAAVAACVIPSALASGALADRIGRKPLLVLAGLVAAAGTFLLILAPGLPWIVVSACVLGVATGTFMATSWAMGSDLVPRQEAGRYLGISNLAGAGAGIVGVGIGGPLADLVNALQPGLGYLTVFSIYGALFLLSAAALVPVKE
jgi:MFS family permease